MSNYAEAVQILRDVREDPAVPGALRRRASAWLGDLPWPELFWSIDQLDLSTRSRNALQKRRDLRFVWELVQLTEGDLLQTSNLGRKSLWEIRDLLAEMGLGFGMKLPDEFTRWEEAPDDD